MAERIELRIELSLADWARDLQNGRELVSPLQGLENAMAKSKGPVAKAATKVKKVAKKVVKKAGKAMGMNGKKKR
jgi:hypothetical protein